MNAPQKRNLVSILLAALVAASAFAMLQQFHHGTRPFLHHAYLCATIIAVAAFAVHKLKLRNPVINAALLFAFCGMLAGLVEAVLLLMRF